MRDYGTTNAAPYASAPAVGAAGDTYFNTTDKSLYVSDGTAWAKVGPGTGGPPSGAAAGDLVGTYPNPTIRGDKYVTIRNLASGTLIASNTTAAFGIQGIPAVPAGFYARLLVTGALNLTSGTLTMFLQDNTASLHATVAVLSSSLLFGFPWRVQVEIGPDSGTPTQLVYASLFQTWNMAPPSTTQAANGNQANVGFKAPSSGAITLWGQFSIADPNNGLFRYTTLAQVL